MIASISLIHLKATSILSTICIYALRLLVHFIQGAKEESNQHVRFSQEFHKVSFWNPSIHLLTILVLAILGFSEVVTVLPTILAFTYFLALAK